MPLITANNLNTIILTDIVNWLSQIKLSGGPNQRLQLGETIDTTDITLLTLTLAESAIITLDELANLKLSAISCTINFYTDKAKTQLAFTDSTASGSEFVAEGNKLYYTPSDAIINSASGLSTTLNQSFYYVTAVYTDGTTLDLSYTNANNLMFQSVIVANKKDPGFTKNENQAIVVPDGEKIEQKKVSGDWAYVVPSFNVYVQMTAYNWAKLSEQERLSKRQAVNNAIRTTLYLDRNRNGTCCHKDGFINGTLVSDMTPIKSDAVLKGVIKVQCSYLVNNSAY